MMEEEIINLQDQGDIFENPLQPAMSPRYSNFLIGDSWGGNDGVWAKLEDENLPIGGVKQIKVEDQDGLL
jgi:hypothetical protein